MLLSVSQKRAADFGKIVQRVSGALPLTSRGQFSRRRKLPEKQSGYLFALLATFSPVLRSDVTFFWTLRRTPCISSDIRI